MDETNRGVSENVKFESVHCEMQAGAQQLNTNWSVWEFYVAIKGVKICNSNENLINSSLILKPQKIIRILFIA